MSNTFHASNYGQFGHFFIADIDGFVAVSADDVLSGTWADDLSPADAAVIAAHNHAALILADERIADWRNG